MEQNPYHSTQPNYPPQPVYMVPKTNGKSIAAMVLGILSIVVPYIGFIIGIVGIVFSSLSLKEIRKTGEQGRGMAIAGMVCSIIGTVIYAIILFLLVIAFVFYVDSVNNSYNV